MKIGLTYDLMNDYIAAGFSDEDAAEFDRLDTIEAIEKALQNLGYTTERIGNIHRLTKKLAAGDRWDLVFNIAEGVVGYGREAQAPALLDAYQIPYTFSDPLVLALTLHKAMTKHVVRDLGINTPDFFVVEDPFDIPGSNITFPLFAKPVAEGTGKGINANSRINSKEELILVCEKLIELFKQPVLVEAFLPGREFTVGITGTGKNAQALGVIEVTLNKDAEPDAYSYLNKKEFDTLVNYRLVDDEEAKAAVKVALKVWKGLGCRDGGRVDLRSDSKRVPFFLEVNPLAGLNPDISDLPILCRLLGVSYLQLISRIVKSALERTNLVSK
jgi:D-alanine-D-alanine ligase